MPVKLVHNDPYENELAWRRPEDIAPMGTYMERMKARIPVVNCQLDCVHMIKHDCMCLCAINLCILSFAFESRSVDIRVLSGHGKSRDDRWHNGRLISAS